MVVTNMKELCEYVAKQKRKTRSASAHRVD